MNLPEFYQFKDPQLARAALTHRSYGSPNNERLEWLGDAIVQLEVSQLLFEQFPRLLESGLSQMRARLVSGAALAEIARRLKLGDSARLGKGMYSGRDNDNLLANLMEAYIAAVYLDGGDVRQLLKTLMQDNIDALAAQIQQGGVRSLANAKTRLQEFLQKHQLQLPRYELIQQYNKADAPTFLVECRAQTVSRRGRGATRAAAEQDAAARCLKMLTALMQKNSD